MTPQRFEALTSHLDILSDSAYKTTTVNSMLRSISKKPKSRNAKIGFHPQDGIGGVLGVIAGDCLNGVHDEPERYFTTFLKN